MISTQEEWRQLGTGAWSRFEGAEERLLLETKAYHKKKCQQIEISSLKSFEKIKLAAKLPDYVLRSIKSSINQN